jgi:hypothetical protein
MDVAVPMVMLQHYLNPCLHYLIGPAMVTLIMWHLDDAVEIARGRYCRLQKSIPKDARWGRTLHLFMLTSGRYSNHSTNVIFSPKLSVTQMFIFSSSLLWIWSQKCVILDINYIFLLMSYIVCAFSFKSIFGEQI